MPVRRYAIIDGPDKPALQSSLANTGEQDVHFRVEGVGRDVFDAQILRMDEEVDGFTFKLQGRLASGRYSGVPFRGVYSVGTRSGWFELHSEGGANNG
jgi:hypothetical protein